MNIPVFVHAFFTYSSLILPWLLVGIFLSYLLDIHFRRLAYRKLTGKAGMAKVIFAQILGMVSPLSILSFLPIVRELTDKGVNPALLLSFLIAERAYDMQSLFIISSLFGVKFALLNVLAILLSLIATAISIKNDSVRFKKNTAKHEGFWLRQGKLFGIVVVGIILGSLIKAVVPPGVFQAMTRSYSGGFVAALVLGFSIYVWPIVGNYPIAKAFSDLGMSPAGIFVFLTVSPICNFMVISLLGIAVGFHKIGKAIVMYAVVSILLSLMFSLLL